MSNNDNQTFRITRKIEIDAAHRVPDHRSKCYNIHGHRYVIEATAEGALFTTGEQRGMVMDFGFLKQVMMDCIHVHFDHACIFYSKDPLFHSLKLDSPDSTGDGWKVVLVDAVPTAENLAREWHRWLQDGIADWFDLNDPEATVPTLVRVRVYETPNCWADYPS